MIQSKRKGILARPAFLATITLLLSIGQPAIRLDLPELHPAGEYEIMPRVVIHNGLDSSRVFELAGDRPVSIGRAKSSDIVLDDASVSRTHAVIRATMDGQWQILDRGSANGVKLNGVSKPEAMLRNDDEITIGIYRLRFEDSKDRKITSYGTVKLPKSVTDALGRQVYSNLSMDLETVASPASTAIQPEPLYTKKSCSDCWIA